MRKTSATVTSKGRITIPADVRRHLGVATGDRVTFVLTDGDTVTMRRSRDLTVAELAGAAGKLPEPLAWEEVIAIAREERAVAWQQRATDAHPDRFAAIERREP